MSFQLPILKNFETTNMLGSPFYKLANDERDRMLMNPVRKSAPNSFKQATGEYEMDGQDYSEHYFPSQGMPREVYSSYEYLNKVMAARQPAFNDDDAINNDGLDPLTLAQMKKEPQKGKDELFDEYGDKTTDFVNLVKRSRRQTENERQLYLTPEERRDDKPSVKENRQELLKMVLENIPEALDSAGK